MSAEREFDVAVLFSDCKYDKKYDKLLTSIISSKAQLFCVAGVECELWEDVMDELCVILDIDGVIPGASIVTTSHPNESREEVLEFAHSWNAHEQRTVEVKVFEI